MPLTTEPPRPKALSSRRAVVLLAALAAVPFAPVLFAGHVLYERDIHLFRWGDAEAFARCIATGSLPLWSAFSGFGRPLLADPGAQVLYPWTWLGLLLPPHDWYDAYAIGHVLLGGAGAFALARRLGSSPAGSLLSGALFLLSGPLLSLTSLWQHLAGAALLPWVLVAGEAALAAPGLRSALAWGAVVALQAFAGSLDFLLLGAFAQAVLALRHAGPGTGRERARRLAALLGAAAFAVALSAVLWVPALELLRTTVRAQLGESMRALWSAHPVLLLQSLAPLFATDLPLGPAARALLYDGREPLLASLYLGVASLPLVLVGLLCAPRRLSIPLGVLGLGAVALALGRHGFAFFWAVDLVPGLDLLRYPVKATGLLALAWALLAGRGIDAWPRAGRGALWAASVAASGVAAGLLVLWSRAPAAAGSWLGPDPGGRAVDTLVARALAPVLAAAVAAATAAALAALSALHPRTRGSLASAALVVAVVDLAAAHRALVPTAPREWFTGVPGVVALAKRDRAERLYAFDYLRRRSGRTGPSWKPAESPELLARPPREAAALASQDYPLDGARWALPGAFDLHVAQLDSPARVGLATLVRFHQEDGPALARLLRLGGVTHLSARHRAGLEVFGNAASVPTAHLGEVHLVRVPGPRPRVFVVEGARVAPGRAAYEALLDPAFDPAREVVLAGGEPAAARDGFVGEARLVSWRSGRLSIAASLSRRGHLVVLEAYDPGWHARVDGRPVAPVAANGVFIGLPIEAGRHEVELSYRPPGLVRGVAVSGLALVAGALLLSWRRPRAAAALPPGPEPA